MNGPEGPSDNFSGKLGNTPDFLKVTSYKVYETADNVGVIGAVKNVGDNPVTNIEVEVTLRDGDTVLGEFVDTSEEEREQL